MQTFLPYSDFARSASVLDRQRLGKQRVEVLQILNAMHGLSRGWSNHPATRMWEQYPEALASYGLYVCHEWIERGYKDTCFDKIKVFRKHPDSYPVYPTWLGNEAFHAAHRSNLLRKDPEYYRQFGWTEPPDLEYVWPV